MPLNRPAVTSSVTIVLYRKSGLPPPPYSSGTAMPRKPCLPASSHTPRATILSRSHCSWWGATWRSRNDRNDSRNRSCSGSNSVRWYLTALPMGDLRYRKLAPKIYQPDGWFAGGRWRLLRVLLPRAATDAIAPHSGPVQALFRKG